MEELKLVHTCNHKIIEREVVTTVVGIVRSSESFDLIPVPNPISIDKITCYGIEIDRALYRTTNSRIIWEDIPFNGTQFSCPSEGDVYTVTFRNIDGTIHIYNEVDCTRCNGVGWYFGTTASSTATETVSGHMKVAQRFLKILLTIPSTDRINEQLGAGLMPLTGVRYFSSSLSSQLYAIVAEAESQCMRELLEDVTATDDELLQSAVIENVVLDDKQGRAYIVIKLTTVGGAKLRFSV